MLNNISGGLKSLNRLNGHIYTKVPITDNLTKKMNEPEPRTKKVKSLILM